MWQYTSNIPYQQRSTGTSNILPLATPQGGNNYQTGWSQLGGTYVPEGNQNPSNIPLAIGFPTKGCILMRITHIQEWLMVVLG